MRDKQAMLLLRHNVSLFGKRPAGALRCWDDHLDKISSSPRRPFVSLLHSCLCSFLTVSVGSATLSASDVRAPLSHMWSERQGCCWCQPAQLSTVLITVDLTAGATPLLLVNQQHRFFSWLPKICFSISVSKGHDSLCAASQLNCADNEKKQLVQNSPCEEECSLYTHQAHPH